MAEHSVGIEGGEEAPWLQSEAERLVALLADRPECVGFGPGLELSILLTDDVGIRELNQRWRQLDSATDVLSFPLGEGGILGDVVISLETARRRVTEPSWSIEDEVLFLLIHGVLHLLGHDHMEDEERAAMEAAEQALWTTLGRPGTLRAAGDEATD